MIRTTMMFSSVATLAVLLVACSGADSTTSTAADPAADPTPAPAESDPVAPPTAPAPAPAPAPGSANSPFQIVDQFAYASGSDFQMKLTDYANGCALQQRGNSHKQNSHYWKIAITGATGAKLVPGKYILNQANANGLTLRTLAIHDRDSSCTEIDHEASSGSVTITGVTATAITGKVEADMMGLGNIQLALDAAVCDTSTSTGTAVCIP
jgi:hypothetical protein